MSYSFNLNGTGEALEIALIRDEIDDISNVATEGGGVEGANYFVTDERIMARLNGAADELPAGSGLLEIRLSACASILDTLATNQAYVLKKQETLDQSMDGPAVADSIRKHAAALRIRVTAARKKREDEQAAANKRPSRKPTSFSVPVNTVF